MIVLSWNMQGAGTKEQTSNFSDAIGLFKKGLVDVLLLQEAGGCPIEGLDDITVGSVKLRFGKKRVGSERSGRDAHVVWYDSKENTGAMHDRCSMAIIAADCSGNACVVEHYSAGLRPLIGIETTFGTDVWNIHAPSGNHKAAAGVAASLLSVIDGSKYICAGDFNCSPDDMVNKGFKPVATDSATHQNGNTLDFAIGSKVKVSLYAGKSIFEQVPLLVSDHYSQCFEVT